MAEIGSVLFLEPTPGATVTVSIGDGAFQQVNARWTAGQDETVNISGTPPDNQHLLLMIINDATAPRVITFGTGLVSSGNLTGSMSKRAIIVFLRNRRHLL